MPLTKPTPPMVAFASQFGSFVMFEDVSGRTISPLFQPAFQIINDMLDSFTGSKNSCGKTFHFDVQVVENLRPSAVCSALGNQCNIVVFSGLLAKIIEVCALALELCRDCYREEAVFNLESGLRAVGINYLIELLKAENTQTLGGVDVIVSKIEASGELPFFCYLTNYTLIFVLLHEGQHGVEGHSFFLEQTEPGVFLGESPHEVLAGRAGGLQRRFELDADVNALFSILADFLRGREYISIVNLEMMAVLGDKGPIAGSYPDLPDRIVAVWLSILLLANTWQYSALMSGRVDTHPLYMDRILSLFWSPTRLEAHDTKRIIQYSQQMLAKRIGQLTVCGEPFSALFLCLTKKGVERYHHLLRVFNTAEELAARTQVARHAFPPAGNYASNDIGVLLKSNREKDV